MCHKTQLCQIKSLLRLSMTKNLLSVFSSSLHPLFKLNYVLPLINSCPKQKTVAKAKQKITPRWLTFVLFLSFSACPHLHACLHSVILHDFRHEDTWPFAIKASSGQLCFFSSHRNGSCTRSICVDDCAGVNADFLPNFHCNNQANTVQQTRIN